MGQLALERLRQVGEDSLGRAWEALRLLVEQMLARFDALLVLLRFLADLFAQLWLQAQVAPVAETVVTGAVHQTLMELLIAVTALGFALVALIVFIAGRMRRAGRRRAEVR